jgi:hypothetical protein
MKKKSFILFIFFILFSSDNAYAYLDPGSASMLLQIIAGVLSSTLIFLNSFNNFIKYILNKKLFSSVLIITLSIFPIWLFKSSFSSNMIISYLVIIYLIPLLLILILIKNIHFYYTSEKLNKMQNFIITCLIFYGLDLNIGLWTLLDYFPFNGKNLYLFSLVFILVSLGIIFYLIKKSFLKYIFILLVCVFSFNLISLNKNLNGLDSKISFNNYSEKNMSIEKYEIKKNPILFIVLDEMNGIGGLDIKIKNYEKAKNSYLDLAQNFNLTIYPNSYTTIPSTLGSIPRMLNFDSSKNDPRYDDYTADHENYFFWRKLIKNKLFDSFDQNKIYVRQTLAIDFCKNFNVVRCETFNPYSKKVLKENDYSNPIIVEFISKLSYQNSIFSRLLSRSLVELNLINLSISPRSDKAYFKKDLTNLFEVIKNEKYDLYFAHYLVPHKPFGFDDKCNYKLFPAMNTNPVFLKTQHNIEIYCVNLFLNDFLEKMKTLNRYKDFKIIIVSDHGSRNTPEPKDLFSVAAIIKNASQKGIINKEIISVQSIVSELFSEKKYDSIFTHKYYNPTKKKFEEIKFN